MPQKLERNKNRVIAPDSVPADSRVLNFSFRYLQKDHPNFLVSECALEFVEALFDRMKYYCEMRVDEFLKPDGKEHRHGFTFEYTNVPTGFPNIDANELGVEGAWQFALYNRYEKPDPHWRVHGFVENATFHIVWLDTKHFLTQPGDEMPARKRKKK